MADTYKYGSIYKVKTGTNTWEHHFFKTRADLVDPAQYTASNTTYYKLPLDTQYHTVNGKNFGQTSGITLGGSDIYVGGSDDSDSANYNQYYDLTLEEAIRYLKAGVDAAQTLDADLTAIAALSGTSGFLKKTAANTWSLDTTVLTSINYSSTLGSVYEAKFTDGSATIASESNSIVTLKAGISQSGGAIGNSSGSNITLAKVAKTGAFGDLSGTGNVVSASSTLTSDKIVEGNGNKTLKVSSYSVSDIVGIAEGKATAYVAHLYNEWDPSSSTQRYLITSDNDISIETTVTYNGTGIGSLAISSSTPYFKVAKRYIYSVEPTEGYEGYKVASKIDRNKLKVGDILYLTETDVPDFWVSAINSSTNEVTFSKLETSKVDLSDYLPLSGGEMSGGIEMYGYDLLAREVTAAGNEITFGHTSGGYLTSLTLKTALTTSSSGDGPYTITLPAATGTVALTSDVSTHTRVYSSGLKISTGSNVDDLYVPAPSTSHGGIVPALVSASVSTQTTSTKFLREDGTWAVPSYTTDTDKKAASGDSDSKIYLIGATSQSTDGQTTYSHGEVYVGTDHCLYSNSVRVRNIYVASSAPSAAVTGDIWIDTTSAA